MGLSDVDGQRRQLRDRTMFASRRFSLRGLLSLMTGLAFVGFVANWMLSLGSNMPRNLLLFVLPWAIGSLAGIATAIRFQRSTVLGSMIGGVVAAILCPGSIVIYLYLNGMNGVNSLSSFRFQLAFAACGSGLLAAFVGIPREGIRLSNKQRN
jgi:hypothetical protein